MTNQTKDQDQKPTYKVVNLKTGDEVTMTFDPDNPESVKAIAIFANDPNVKIVAE